MTPNSKQIFCSMLCLPLTASAAPPAALALSYGAPLHGGSGEHRGSVAWTFYHENVMGTSMEVTVRATSSEVERAEAAVLASIDRHTQVLSSWDPASELSRWLATREETKVSPELFEVLSLFDLWRERTEGALDASAETAVQLWRRNTAAGRHPSEVDITEAVKAMQQPHWKLNAVQGTATHLSDTPLALASFTKSYAAHKAADAALASGATGVMLNIGGDVVVRGALLQAVDIADPRADGENDLRLDRVVVRDRAVATSGSYRRGFALTANALTPGLWASHILDPRTGQPTGHILSSTVIARDAATAGALATAFSVMSVEESKALAERVGGVDFLLVKQDGEVIASAGWQGYRAPFVRTVAYATPHGGVPAPAPSEVWNETYELVVGLEIAQNNASRYRRPYVAVWVEDEKHMPIRTIALWYNKQRYLPDIKDWYRVEKTRVAAGGANVTGTVGSATRSPGSYTLKWDGRDNDGNFVKAGRYTVCVEAAREHGGLEFLHEELDFNGKPTQHTFQPGSELGAVTLDYRKHK